MRVFNLFVFAIVALALIFILQQILVFNPNEIYGDLTKLSQKAMANPGIPFCKEINLNKSFSFDVSKLKIITKSVDFKLYTFNKNIIVVSKNKHHTLYSQNSTKTEACVICHPKILFNTKTPFCEIEMGKKEKPLENISIPKTSENLKSGVYYKKININSNKKLKLIILENSTKPILDLFLSGEKKYDFYTQSIKDNNIKIPLNGNGIFTIIWIVSNSNIIKDSYLGPVKYVFENVSVKQDYDSISKSCKATTKSKPILDELNNTCSINYNCQGCMFPSMCVDAWKTKGINNLTENTKDYAVGNVNINKCND